VYTIMDNSEVERLNGGRLSMGSHGYVQMCPPGNGACVLLHRWIMGARTGDGRLVDHADRNPLDNLRSNLEFVTASESSSNVTGSAKSGYRGVDRARSGRFAARAKKNGTIYYLGTYDTIDEAAQVAHDWRVTNLPGYRDKQPTRIRRAQ
jgi:hypothetical protein